MGRYRDHAAPFVVIDAGTGRRHPVWVENDSRAPDDAHRLTFVRPARTSRRATATWWPSRGLVDGTGQALVPSDVFRAYRDNLSTGIESMVNFPFLGRLLKHPRACRPTPPSRTASAPSCSTSRTCRSSA